MRRQEIRFGSFERLHTTPVHSRDWWFCRAEGVKLQGEVPRWYDLNEYRALVEDARATYRVRKAISEYTEPHDLSALEVEIFGIDTDLLPDLAWAYERYENLIGFLDAAFGEFTEQERIDHARYFQEESIWSFNHAVCFMVDVCGLPQPQCMAWIAKIVAAKSRGGLYVKPD